MLWLTSEKETSTFLRFCLHSPSFSRRIVNWTFNLKSALNKKRCFSFCWRRQWCASCFYFVWVKINTALRANVWKLGIFKCQRKLWCTLQIKSKKKEKAKEKRKKNGKRKRKRMDWMKDLSVDIPFVCLKLRRPTSLSLVWKKLKETATAATATMERQHQLLASKYKQF